MQLCCSTDVLTGKLPASGQESVWASGPGSDRKVTCLRPGERTRVWYEGRGWSGAFGVLGGLGDGDVEAQSLDLADVVAELAVRVGAGLVVAVAEVGVAGFGVFEQVPDDDQDGAGDGDLGFGLAAAAGDAGAAGRPARGWRSSVP